jgi:hypothetical protein
MTLQQAMDQADNLKPNMMDRDMKIMFLQEIEQKIYTEILLKHEHEETQEVMPAYDSDTDAGTVLLVPDPYSVVYVYWLLSKIDFQNLEMDKYNNDRAMFENAYGEMQDWWNRTYMPIQKHRQIWI